MLQKRVGLRKNYFLQQSTVGKINEKKPEAQFFFALSIAGGEKMVEVYFYMPANQAENAVECGMKLSEWYSREVEIGGEIKKCISALLNPRDDYEKYMSQEYKCLKLEVQSKYCYVADSLLYEAGLAHPEVMEMYAGSILPIEKYAFGDYRLPECLITGTIIGENINVLGKGLDTPVLYNNSQELYFGNMLEGFREEHEDFDDTLLYHFFKRLCSEAKASCVEDPSSGLAVFRDTRSGRIYTLRIPDMGRY
jgi:hypothetical protein